MIQDVTPEELQAVAVDLDGTPGVRVDQRSEVARQLFGGEFVGAAIEGPRNTPQRPSIGIDGLVTHALEFQGAEMAFVEVVEAALFASVHAKLLINRPGMGDRELIRDAVLLPLLSGFVQQSAQADALRRGLAGTLATGVVDYEKPT